MEMIIACSLALNIVLFLVILSMKRRVDKEEKEVVAMLRALNMLNSIAKKAFVGDHINQNEIQFMNLLDVQLELEKERQKAKLNA